MNRAFLECKAYRLKKKKGGAGQLDNTATKRIHFFPILKHHKIFLAFVYQGPE